MALLPRLLLILLAGSFRKRENAEAHARVEAQALLSAACHDGAPCPGLQTEARLPSRPAPTLDYKKAMKVVLDIFERRVPQQDMGFSGLKDGALVFWRNYPEFEPMDALVQTYKHVHLLNVSGMQREESKVCSVLGKPQRRTNRCDMVHYCVGTVQRAWNYALARAVLHNEQAHTGGAFEKQRKIAFGEDAQTCERALCNNFKIDWRYACPANNTEQYYEWITNPP